MVRYGRLTSTGADPSAAGKVNSRWPFASGLEVEVRKKLLTSFICSRLVQSIVGCCPKTTPRTTKGFAATPRFSKKSRSAREYGRHCNTPEESLRISSETVIATASNIVDSDLPPPSASRPRREWRGLNDISQRGKVYSTL